MLGRAADGPRPKIGMARAAGRIVAPQRWTARVSSSCPGIVEIELIPAEPAAASERLDEHAGVNPRSFSADS